MSARPYDVVIVGGGPTGAALAIALQGSGLTVLVLEARPDAGNSNDARTLAMSYGSRLILERLGIWSLIEPVTPIESIHVSQRGGFGRTLLSADEAGLPALGYVVRYARLQQAFGKAIGSEHTTLMAGAEVFGMDSTAEAVCIGYRSQGIMQSAAARLLVIADGGASAGLRAGAAVKIREYGQDAVVGLVETARPHERKAYERFTPDGPIALLPFENRYALVWTATPETANGLMEFPATGFLDKLQRHFGDRAGRFISIEARARFPLILRYAADPVLPRAVMLGNAAQALHPIAGQGFNLGLRDAWELGETLLLHAARDPGSDECLSSYRTTRRPDRQRGIALTHSLVKIFSNDFAPLRATRGAALALLELVPPAKRAFMQRMIFGASR
ncbi:MAG: FAD-dependent monooxygenase [Betaproteobacteria bacterium]|nr:FAD-dependent monooxygenase [Betaproteobacteria bacterium]